MVKTSTRARCFIEQSVKLLLLNVNAMHDISNTDCLTLIGWGTRASSSKLSRVCSFLTACLCFVIHKGPAGEPGVAGPPGPPGPRVSCTQGICEPRPKEVFDWGNML